MIDCEGFHNHQLHYSAYTIYSQVFFVLLFVEKITMHLGKLPIRALHRYIHRNSRQKMRLTGFSQQRHKGRRGYPAPPSGCRKKPLAFSTACNNVVIFVPPCGTKIVASLHARLAMQGFARHLILFEAGFAPSSSPCVHEPLVV